LLPELLTERGDRGDVSPGIEVLVQATNPVDAHRMSEFHRQGQGLTCASATFVDFANAHESGSEVGQRSAPMLEKRRVQAVKGLGQLRHRLLWPLKLEEAESVVALQLRCIERANSHLPWREPEGRTETAGLVVTTRERTALARTYFNRHVWKPALDAAGVPATREDGMHALRHTYASVLLEDGVSIKALAEYLGHADPGLTLRTYTHLMPSSEDRARTAVDRAFATGRPLEGGRSVLQSRR
jgi:hypothetical protein